MAMPVLCDIVYLSSFSMIVYCMFYLCFPNKYWNIKWIHVFVISTEDDVLYFVIFIRLCSLSLCLSCFILIVWVAYTIQYTYAYDLSRCLNVIRCKVKKKSHMVFDVFSCSELCHRNCIYDAKIRSKTHNTYATHTHILLSHFVEAKALAFSMPYKTISCITFNSSM